MGLVFIPEWKHLNFQSKSTCHESNIPGKFLYFELMALSASDKDTSQ